MMAKEGEPAFALQSGPHTVGQGDVVFPGSIEPALLNKADPGRQPRHPQDIGRPAFEEIWEFPGLCLAGGITTRAPFTPGTHLHARANVENPRASWTQERLVAGKGKQIDTHGPDINGHH